MIDRSDVSVLPQPGERCVEFGFSSPRGRDDAAVVENDDPVGDLCLTANMGGDYERPAATVTGKAPHDIPSGFAVKAFGGLIEQPEFGAAQEQAGKC